MTLPRSYLYVPGNAPDKLAKAASRGADALIVDLEDAVPPSEKERALEDVLAWLASCPPRSGPELWVRVNPAERRMREVAALAGVDALTGLVLAKTEDVADLEAVAGSSAGLLLMPMIETAGAVLDARELARGPRVRQLQIGEVDLAAETGLRVSEDESELAPYRAQVVLASAAAAIAPPPAPVSRETRDLDRFATSTRRLMRQGFHGRVCIHPGQVGVVHDLMRPTVEEVEEASETVALLEEAERTGAGVVLDRDGRLVDAAVIRAAQTVLALDRQVHDGQAR